MITVGGSAHKKPLDSCGKDWEGYEVKKKKKLSVSEGYEVHTSFFLKILDQFARESFDPPARKTP